MINYYRLWDYMNRNGVKQKELKTILAPATINKLRKNDTITSDTINKLCAYLHCQPGDILEYQPDADEESE